MTKNDLILAEKKVIINDHSSTLSCVVQSLTLYKIGSKEFEKTVADIFEIVNRINDVIKELPFLEFK